MSKKIYVVTMENNETDIIEIGYASKPNIANKMIKKISSTDGFEHNTYKSYQATVDYMEINNEPICFEEEYDTSDYNDLLIRFAILWGMKINAAVSSKEIKIAKEMKLWDSVELYELFSSWRDEYLTQDSIDDVTDFFQEKLTNLFHE